MEKNNLDKQHIVSRSRPLLSLNKSELSLYELKVLDTYLSRINPHKPEERTVIFDKGSFEALFEYSELKLPELKAHLKNLQSLDVDIATSENEIDNIKLFSRAQARKDKYGLWEVILTCSPEAMTYFFNIESLGYLRYKLWNVLQLNSRYSYLMFLYLTDNRFRKEWKVSIDELKDILNCGQIESYSEFKNLDVQSLTGVKARYFKKLILYLIIRLSKEGVMYQIFNSILLHGANWQRSQHRLNNLSLKKRTIQSSMMIYQSCALLQRIQLTEKICKLSMT